jgi:hypothetical protein
LSSFKSGAEQMAAKQLKGDGNLADEIVDVLCVGKSESEMFKIAKSFLDNTLNHPNVEDYLRAQMVGAICWENGLNPPDAIKELIM